MANLHKRTVDTFGRRGGFEDRERYVVCVVGENCQLFWLDFLFQMHYIINMKTKIPVGTIVKVRYKGDYEYAKVVELPTAFQHGDDKYALHYFVMKEEEKKNAVKAVWRGYTLEQR